MKKRISINLFLFFLLLTFFTSAQVFDWEWQNPTPTGADHNDAIVLTPTTFLLVGNGGSVLRSTDAGLTWSLSYVDEAERNIYSAKFVDDNIGYIAGTGGLLMKTTDGGVSWFHQTSGTTNILWDVEFYNADTGFAVGATGVILSTTDGGTNWALSNYGTTTIYKAHFTNKTTCYIGSANTTTGRLIRTTDGGATWIDITANVTGLTGIVRGIHFVDESNGWISNSTGRIFKTTNGGTTWSESYYIGSTTVTIYEVKFIDLNNGFALTTAGRVLKTTNGGTDWSLIQTEATKNLFGLGILGVRSKDNEATTPVLIGGDAGTAIKSMDNGVTWDLAHYAASQELLLRSSFPSENVGYVVGGSITTGNQFGDVLKTTNGGTTWVKLPLDAGYRTYSVFFTSENVGYVGERGPTGVYKTTDGGQNWTQLNTGAGVATSIIYDIRFYDENNGFAMYSSGQIAKTTNGGTNWTVASAGWGSAAGYELFIVNPSVIYACGGGGRVSKSTDGGNTFSQLPTLGTATLYSMHFFDANTGFIAASGGNLFKTINGIDFTPVTNPVTSIIYTLNFYNNSIGWMGTSTNGVYYTEDGGDTWTKSKLSIGNSQAVRDIQFGGGYLWLVGADGMIIRGFADPQIPVELTSFAASVINGMIYLNWQTATETNNAGFEIQRSSEKSNWTEIGFVTGNGTTAEIQNYSYTDQKPNNGVNYYRLKQIDYDGSYEYSKVIEVDLTVPQQFVLEQNYPNPFNPVTMINYQLPENSFVTLKIYDLIGNLVTALVNEEQSAGRYALPFDASGLASGFYFYTIKTDKFTDSKKMLLLK